MSDVPADKFAPQDATPSPPQTPWISRTVLGIVFATLFSDFSHEMATAVLPLYLTTLGLGPAALGMMEGVADLLVSLSKLGGGVLGHRVRRKRPWASLCYLTTTVATAGMGLVTSIPALVGLRGAAWVARGVRGPLRDHLLADAVEPTHYGRAYGLERAGDMLGAVAGPLVTALLISRAIAFRTLMLATLVPGLLAAGSMFWLTRERDAPSPAASRPVPPRPGFPRTYWLFVIGVFLFGLGDFSRTFLVWLVAATRGSVGGTAGNASGLFTTAVLLYAVHNAVAAIAAYPAGRLGDRASKLSVLLVGYGIGVGTNLVLAFGSTQFVWVGLAILLSGVYISIEDTLEKAAAAELLPRELRSLGFGILACANAVGDMASSVYVGALLERGHPGWAFGIAAALGLAGVLWLTGVVRGAARLR